MRIGINPQKLKDLELVDAYHHVLIPVHIPELKGYYLQALDVLKLCLDSLLVSIHEKTIVTIINNGSCEEVVRYLRELKDSGRLYRVIDYVSNQGKVDPIISAMKGCRETLITVSDCDVLFTPGWQQAVEQIFSVFPRTGFVSPLPQPSLAYYYSQWSWYYGFTRNCIKRIPLQDVDTLIAFKRSIGVETLLSTMEINPFVLEKDGCIAILGAGHFCGTFSKHIIPFLPKESAGSKFWGTEETALDKPIADSGLLRLSTAQGWVYHIGNIPELWMNDFLLKNKKHKNIDSDNIDLKKGFLIRNVRLFSKLLSYNKIINSLCKVYSMF